jgi:hypothetical protein
MGAGFQANESLILRQPGLAHHKFNVGSRALARGVGSFRPTITNIKERGRFTKSAEEAHHYNKPWLKLQAWLRNGMVGHLPAVFNLLLGKLKHMVSEDMPLRAIATMGNSISFHDVHIIMEAAAAITFMRALTVPNALLSERRIIFGVFDA